MAPASCAEQAEQLAAEGRFPDAVRALQRGAAAGDPAALLTLAFWRIGGTIIRRDLTAARQLLAEAAARGSEEAQFVHAYFVASGRGGEPDWRIGLREIERMEGRAAAAREQLGLVRRMALDEDGGPPERFELEQMSTDPAVAVARAFLTADECDYLRRAAEPRLEPSVIVDPSSGQLRPHPIRTSLGAFFGVTQEDLVVTAINRRIACLSATHPAQGEPLQILSYDPGAQYRLHLDAIGGADNQRILTVLVYLTEDYEGGRTIFPDAGLSFKGRKGDALLFRNVAVDGAPDPRVRHAGEPVRRGRKVIASRWIRAHPFCYPDPVPATGTTFG